MLSKVVAVKIMASRVNTAITSLAIGKVLSMAKIVAVGLCVFKMFTTSSVPVSCR